MAKLTTPMPKQTVTTLPLRMKLPERLQRIENEKPGRETGLFVCGDRRPRRGSD